MSSGINRRTRFATNRNCLRALYTFLVAVRFSYCSGQYTQHNRAFVDIDQSNTVPDPVTLCLGWQYYTALATGRWSGG